MRRLADERGATAVLVAILIVVLVGFAAFAVDVGALYQERRELQNGADGAALATAQECASDLAACLLEAPSSTDCVVDTSLFSGIAHDYADWNANDGKSNVECVLIDISGESVTVTTRTEVAGTGADAIPHWFAPVLGIPESTVGAQASARWGTAGAMTTLPLAICERAFNFHTETGTAFGGPPYTIRYAVPNPASPLAANEDCSNPSYDTYSGGFGWLDTDEDCEVATEVDGWFPGTTGNQVTNSPDCSRDELVAKLRVIAENGGVVLVPIFDAYRGDGTNGEFHIKGFGAFHLHGFYFGKPEYRYPSTPANQPCRDPYRCIRGYFTEFVSVEGWRNGAAAYMGVRVVQLTG